MFAPKPLDHLQHVVSGGLLFAPTGTHLLIRSPSSTLLCEVPSARLVTEIPGAAAFVYAFSPDGRFFVHAHDGHVLPLHDTASGALIANFTMPRDAEEYAQSATFHPDGERILVGTSEGSVRVWNRLSGKVGKPMRRGNNGISAIHVLGDETRAVFVTAYAKTIRVWDIEKAKALYAFEHAAPVRTVSVDSSLRRVVTSTKSGLFVWDLETGRSIATITDPRVRDCNGHTVLEQGALVATARDHAIHLWDTSNGGHVVSLPMRAPGEIALDRLDDSHLFVLCNGSDDAKSGMASVWNVSKREEVVRLDHPRAIHATDVSRGGVLALADARQELHLFDLGMSFAAPRSGP